MLRLSCICIESMWSFLKTEVKECNVVWCVKCRDRIGDERIHVGVRRDCEQIPTQ